MFNYQKILSYLLLAIILLRFCWVVAFRADWAVPSQAKLSRSYEYSQYCLTGLRDQFGLDKLIPEYTEHCSSGAEFRGNIDDPELYVLAGSQYVRGVDPSAISWELQPLTKYLYGAVMSFGIAPLVVQWLMFTLLLSTIYLLGRRLGMEKYQALLAPALLSFDSLIYEQLTRPYLDLTQTALITLTLYLLLRFVKKEVNLLPFAIVLGLVSLSKSFAMGGVLTLVAGIIIVLYRREMIATYLKSLCLTLCVYLLGYTMFFARHGIFNLDFINLHITILKFYKNYVPEYPWGEIWRVLMLGEWRTWWGAKGYQRVGEWSIWWPIGTVTMIPVFLTSKLEAKAPTIILLTWTVIYLLFASIRLVFPRYLLPILPEIYLFSVIMLVWLYNLFNSTKKVNATSQK
jgi:hypothetical protein